MISAVAFACLLLSFSPLALYAFTNGQNASIVLGQSSFTSSGCGAISKTSLCIPFAIAVSSSGTVWVADSQNNRTLGYVNPTKNGQAASVVLGQPSFTSGTAVTSQSGLNGPAGVAIGPLGNIWIGDDFNSRVIQFVTTTTTSVTCAPVTVAVGSASTCTAKVSDTKGFTATPAGTVTFANTAGAGTFSSVTCTLSGSGTSAECSVNFTPSSAPSGRIKISGTYGGNSNHLGSEGSTVLGVT